MKVTSSGCRAGNAQPGPRGSTLGPQPSALGPQHSTDPRPAALDAPPWVLTQDPRPSPREPRTSTSLDPRISTLEPRPSTLDPRSSGPAGTGARRAGGPRGVSLARSRLPHAHWASPSAQRRSRAGEADWLLPVSREALRGAWSSPRRTCCGGRAGQLGGHTDTSEGGQTPLRMPPAGRKRLGRKAPAEPQRMAACDSGGGGSRELSGPEAAAAEGNHPVTEHDGEGSPPAGTFLEDVWNELQDMMERFEGEIKELFDENRKRVMMETKASVESINQKIEHVWKTQEEQRQELHHEYSQEFLTLFQELAIDIQKTKEEEEKLANIFQLQQELLQHSKTVESQRMRAFKELHEQLLKDMRDLDINQDNFLTGEQSTLGEEMSMWQKQLVMEHQRHQAALLRESLRSLLECVFDDI
ncbi:synaptonemal complex protein 3-like isoform X3 [Canis lupus dingo]|uniref:XLR/SYCP3/FAM9 domain-containing protein n=1 Tax=Canis lupus familiaris TaxID=9615 RepID=A0A8C0STT5_CANLF|nr:synaptonemal complex protein 3-like isoform X2 [Canis lupus dingo]XP_048963178.1 synaptonemal complex protein 3-like isoform X1 [Canis lupus dingo]XP_048963179.1 synaptonemal complex protein 3-like isoform X3 [Canis lupus dingo]|eukprot:XP_005642037.1 synaptonemal complex protein 3-like isoform X1 [Canis lupus familiaris]